MSLRPARLYCLLCLAVWLSLAGVAFRATPAAGRTHALAAAQGTWEPLGLTGPVRQLFTPASGAFFARTPAGLFRSDDGGTSWAPVPLPPASSTSPRQPDVIQPNLVQVDPLDHRVLYAQGTEGLYKSDDDAASWRLLPLSLRPGEEGALAISPADHQVVYLALTTGTAAFRFLRSRDGGNTWDEQAGHPAVGPCRLRLPLLAPHPTAPERVFWAGGCSEGHSTGGLLEQSTDQGATWSVLFNLRLEPGSTLANPRPSFAPAYPTRLAGGQGEQPQRFYLGANHDDQTGGSSVFRSDDNGTTWSEMLAFRGGGTYESPQQPKAPNVQVGGLAYDPGRPDRVYVGLASHCADYPQQGCDEESRVQASTDGGTTWTELGLRGKGRVNDLALGIDGLNLYAATDQGLWRLSLTLPSP